MSLSQLRQSTRSTCQLWPRIAVDRAADAWMNCNWLIITISLFSFGVNWVAFSASTTTYAAFQFGWKTCLKFDGRAIAVITLNEYFHVIWLQGWCARLRHGARRCIFVFTFANQIIMAQRCLANAVFTRRLGGHTTLLHDVAETTTTPTDRSYRECTRRHK